MIDTHLHIIDRKVLDYPWLAAVPELNRDFLWAEYQAEAQKCGITHAICMEADVKPEQNWDEMRYFDKIAVASSILDHNVTSNIINQNQNKDNAIIGAVIAARPESPNFSQELPKISENKRVKGIRRILHTVAQSQLTEILASPIFADNLRRLADYDLSFDLCCPIEAALPIAKIIDQAPDTRFILDHAGRPNIDQHKLPDNIQAWRNGIKTLAKRPNLSIKISGLVDRADVQNWRVDDLRPYFDYVIENFGWHRVVWGSDWPICCLAGGLSQWVAASLALAESASKSEQNAFFCENAKQIYRLSVEM